MGIEQVPPSKVHLGLRVTSSSVGIASSNGNVMRSSHKHTHLRKLHNCAVRYDPVHSTFLYYIGVGDSDK